MTSETPEKRIHLFRNGRNQALRVPRGFELEGDEAIIRKEGDPLVIEPIRKGGLLAVLASLAPLDETFPDVDENFLPGDEVEAGLADDPFESLRQAMLSA